MTKTKLLSLALAAGLLFTASESFAGPEGSMKSNQTQIASEQRRSQSAQLDDESHNDVKHEKIAVLR